ncbi:MAG TPA: hypothetical protein VFM34_04320 [Moraxellaceae bacterium]|nr:hypothetical protein [Moraxellaceae bacterium]
MAERYRLVYRGKLLPGMSPPLVAANLSNMFGIAPEQATELVSTFPGVVRTDLDVDQGNRFQAALANAGLITHLEPAYDASGESLPLTWDGVERRAGGDRRSGLERRALKRETSMRPDRRQGRGRRKSDKD